MDLDESELAGASSPDITYTAWEDCLEASRLRFLKFLKFLKFIKFILESFLRETLKSPYKR